MEKDIFQKYTREIENGETVHKDTGRKISKILLKAVQASNEMVLITTAPDKIGDEELIFVNKAFENITQYSKEEVLGRSPSFLQGRETDPEVIDKLVQKLEKGKHFEGETFNYKKDGTPYRVRWSIDPVYEADGHITHFVSVQRDVTREWEQKQRLQEIINERETLVKETHHRVKNNLATITGLLELQIMESQSADVREVLSESMNRVKSIASIHEKLYETEDLSNITLDAYITDLVEHINQSMDHMKGISDVIYDLDLEEISLRTHEAVPLGLIINELITNSHKHAFENSFGKITIRCKKQDSNIELIVKDNGKGLPENFDIDTISSLGIKLIDSLCKQLDADYNFTSKNGTRFRMEFTKE